MPTFEQIITAEFDFAAMKELIFKIYTHPYVDKAVQFVAEFVESISPFLWAGILLALGLVLSNFGKKLLAVPLVVGIAGIGFLGGAVYLAPRIAAFVDGVEFIKAFISIDPIVVGIVFAAIGAILFLPIYYLGYAAGFGYLTYLFVYPFCNTLFESSTAMIIGLGAAVAVAVVAFIFRKWIEMAVTSVAGAYIVMWAVYVAFPLPEIANYIIWAVFAVGGLIVQIKTRRRY